MDSEPEAPAQTPDEKKKAHDEAEAKRKAEWDEKQKRKKEADNKILAETNAMSDAAVAEASVKKIGSDVERLTRRNMKICVGDHINEVCAVNPEFARKVMHPRKNMINCFKYITHLAKEYIKKEMEDNGESTKGCDIGGDVPDDICFKWAVDYFNDPDAQEDKTDDEKFVPKKNIRS